MKIALPGNYQYGRFKGALADVFRWLANQFAQAAQEYRKQIERRLHGKAWYIARIYLRYAKLHCPVDSGRLRCSLKVTAQVEGGRRSQVRISIYVPQTRAAARYFYAVRHNSGFVRRALADTVADPRVTRALTNLDIGLYLNGRRT